MPTPSGYVARQLDRATPQPVQKMTFEGLLHFVAQQQRLAGKVYTCYEAGAFGYYLHRQLTDRTGKAGVQPYLKSGASKIDADPAFREQFDQAVEESVGREETDLK